MRDIVMLSLRFRILVVAVAAVVIGIGCVQLRGAQVDTLPEFAPVQVQIQAEALGLSAPEVEQMITVPLEQDLLNGVPWLAQIRSESISGLSSIDMVFQPGTDMLKARQMVQERMTQAHALPNVGTPPVMVQPLSANSRVMMIGLSAKDLSLIDMSVLARWKIKPRLMGIPGVANVAIWGQRDRQLQVEVDPGRLRRAGVSLTQVITTTGNALWVSPLTFVEASTPGTGGFIDGPNQRIGVQHVLPITTAAGLASVSVEDTPGRSLRLGDVATVVEDHQPLTGDAVLNGGSGLMLVVEKFPNANPREVTGAVEAALTGLKPGLAGITVDTTIYRPATYMDSVLRNLAGWGLIALVLLMMLLGLAFFSWRAALVGLVVIPLSLATASFVLYLSGAAFNVMVLAGLTIALGAVIDDVVVDMDRMRRRLREHRASPGDGPAGVVIAEASTSIRGPLVYAALVAIMAAVPLTFLDGPTAAFTRPLVFSYVLALLASTVVALTVTPALASLLLGNAPAERRTSPLPAVLHRVFGRAVRGFLVRPRLAYAAVALLVFAVVAALPEMATPSLLVAPESPDLLVHLGAAPGTSLAEMTRVTAAAGREVRGVRGVATVAAHVGRALVSDRPVDVNAGELWVGLAGGTDHRSAETAIQHVVDGYPGLRGTVTSYAQEQINAARDGSPDTVTVRVYGNDFDALRAKAGELRTVMAGVGGVVKPVVEVPPTAPALEVKVDLAAAARYGINPGDVRRSASTYFGGLMVGNLYEEQKVFDVVVWGAPATRSTPGALANLVIDTPTGDHVRLGDVATVRIAPLPTVIKHDATSRSLDVTTAVSDRSVAAVSADLQRRIGTVAMPPEFHAEVLGDLPAQQTHDRLVAGVALAAVAGIFLLLQAAFARWRLAVLACAAIPLAGTGGLVVIAIEGGVFSLGSLVGLCMVLTVSARHIILIIRSLQRLATEDGATPGRDAVVHATVRCAAPVLITAFATALAVLPLIPFAGYAGAQILDSLAPVVIGGMVTSTLVTIFVVPALYLRHTAVHPDGSESPAAAVAEPGALVHPTGSWGREGHHASA